MGGSWGSRASPTRRRRGSMSSPQVFRDPADISRRAARGDPFAYGRVSTRLGLPTLSENLWETREIQLEWFGMLVAQVVREGALSSQLRPGDAAVAAALFKAFLRDPRHLVGRHGAAEEPSRGDEADTTGPAVSIDFSRRVALYAIPDDHLGAASRPEEQPSRARRARRALGHDLGAASPSAGVTTSSWRRAMSSETDLDDAGLAADAAGAAEQGLRGVREHDPSEQSDRRPAATSALKRTALQARVAAAASAAGVVVFSEI